MPLIALGHDALITGWLTGAWKFGCLYILERMLTSRRDSLKHDGTGVTVKIAHLPVPSVSDK